MSITPEATAKTLTQLVATEIKVQMARADVRQSQLAREIGKTEQWLSVRLRGRQPIDVNDLHLIATGLGVSVYDLLPPAETAASASVSVRIPRLAVRSLLTARPQSHRPRGREDSPHGRIDPRRPDAPRRTARLPRADLLAS
jgi:transcriptional regulator with XRE-family HTH domain